jgi:hypothetical protein
MIRDGGYDLGWSSLLIWLLVEFICTIGPVLQFSDTRFQDAIPSVDDSVDLRKSPFPLRWSEDVGSGTSFHLQIWRTVPDCRL